MSKKCKDPLLQGMPKEVVDLHNEAKRMQRDKERAEYKRRMLEQAKK